MNHLISKSSFIMPSTCLAILVCLFVHADIAFAETEYLKIGDHNHESRYFDLKTGDEMQYQLAVRGGANDDVNFIIYYPDGTDDGGGRVYSSYDGRLTARISGTYQFVFDNSFSLLSNKDVTFSYEITKNTFYIHVDDLPGYAKEYAGNAVYDATQYWKQQNPKLNFWVAENESDADTMISWVRDFGDFNDHIGYQYVRLVEVGIGDSTCYGDWKEYHSDYITAIVTHEIGHAIGLGHSNNPNDIMYPSIHPGITKYSSPCVDPSPSPLLAISPDQKEADICGPGTMLLDGQCVVSGQTISSRNDGGGGCLVATAAYGSELAPQVQQLREIRDNVIHDTALGTSFIANFNQLYYLFSPAIADMQRENPIFRDMVKTGITPMLATLQILNHVDSEETMLMYGLGVISLNIGMYLLMPISGIVMLRKFFN